MERLFIICMLAILSLSLAFPVNFVKNPEEGDFFEGDLLLSDARKRALFSTRNGLIENQYRWWNNILYYTIKEDDFTREQIDHILLGMKTLEDVSCLKFVDRKNVSHYVQDYVYVTGLSGGCYSEVGRIGGPQQLNLQPNDINVSCFRLGTIMHEFLHALGFYHQQSNWNRDQFVEIVFDNIQSGMEHNFNKYDVSTVTDFGSDYDYNSVLHYGETAFSKNGERTIIPINQPNVTIGQRLALSELDILKLNKMYECPDK